jgi:hypothetical protein
MRPVHVAATTAPMQMIQMMNCKTILIIVLVEHMQKIDQQYQQGERS